MTGQRNLTRLFQPRSIALIGASDRSAWSATAFDNLQKVGFDGPIHLINRRGGTAHGRPVLTSCRDIGEPVDVAILMVPADALMETFADMAAAGIPHAAVLTSGFAELGSEGARRQAELAQAAADFGMSFLGPNCMGFFNFSANAAGWTGSARTPVLRGAIGVVSQSGAIANFVAHFAHQQGIGLSCLVSTGNEASIDIAAVIDYLVDDPATTAIAVFAETVRDVGAFASAASRALAAGKPIVVLKIGRSAATAEAAQSHTGAIVGDDKVFDAVCRQYGLIRVDSLEELVFTAHTLALVGKLKGDGVGIVSFSGGICELTAEWADVKQLSLPPLAEATVGALRAVMPAFGTPHNPLDITGAAVGNPDLFEQSLKAMAVDPSYAMIACIFDVPTGLNNDWSPTYTNAIAAIGRGLAAISTPSVLISHSVKSVPDQARDLVAAHRLPYVAAGCEMGIRAVANAVRWSRRARAGALVRKSVAASAVPAAFPRGERGALEYLQRYDVPVIPAVLASSADAAVAAAATMNGPVALKIASPDIPHKSDIGGVMLNVTGAEAVAAAYTAIVGRARKAKPQAAIDGVIVSPMRRGGLELLAGVKVDPQWGPVIAVGLGGVWVEILEDVALRLLPVSADEVVQMLGELRAAKLLSGYRDIPAADARRVAEVISRIGDAALGLGDALEAFEVNPLFVNGSHVEALDALAVARNITN